MSREDTMFEYKSLFLRDLSKFPDNKISARRFIGNKIRDLKKDLKKEKSAKRRVVLRKMIKIYEEMK